MRIGGFVFFHNANLDSGGLTSKEHIVGDVEVIERVAGGVFRRDIQSDKVVPFVLDLRAIGDIKTHPAENLQKLVYCLRNDVGFADADGYAGKRDIRQFSGLRSLIEGAAVLTARRPR